MLAKVAGLPPLLMMEGFWPGVIRYDRSLLDEGNPVHRLLADMLEELPIKWECLKPDPLCVLLYHSDCDGIIEHMDCKPIAERLKELIPLLPMSDGAGHIGNWRDKTQAFVDGLLEAHEAGEGVEFS